MNNDILKNLLSRLSEKAFHSFILSYYNSTTSAGDLEPLQEVGNNVYYRGLLDSYGKSLHTVFLLQFLPIELFKNPEVFLLEDKQIIHKLKKVCDIYKGQMGAWGMVSESLRYDYKLQAINLTSNLTNVHQSLYFDELLPKFNEIINKTFRRKTISTFIGSFDSFIDLDNPKIINSFLEFIKSNKEGIRISLSSENIAVDRFSVERNLFSGVTSSTNFPYQSIFVNNFNQKEEILREFEFLINQETSETTLENFLIQNYKTIFGNKYDRIETQLWLKFPELDIAEKNRRLDIFIRNSVINDWELFELKSVTKLSQSYRDIPVLSKEISYTIQQIKNYSRTLSQNSVKEHFAKQGIQYFEPSLNIVIGNKPQISHEQWRWLVSNDKEVKILTFDNLLSELKLRLKERSQIIDNVKTK